MEDMEDLDSDHSVSSDDGASSSGSSDDDASRARIKRKVDNYVLWSLFIISVYHLYSTSGYGF